MYYLYIYILGIYWGVYIVWHCVYMLFAVCCLTMYTLVGCNSGVSCTNSTRNGHQYCTVVLPEIRAIKQHFLLPSIEASSFDLVSIKIWSTDGVGCKVTVTGSTMLYIMSLVTDLGGNGNLEGTWVELRCIQLKIWVCQKGNYPY